MKILVTGRALLDRGCWIEACALTGTNTWIFNEGRADPDDYTVELTIEQAQQLGLLKENPRG